MAGFGAILSGPHIKSYYSVPDIASEAWSTMEWSEEAFAAAFDEYLTNGQTNFTWLAEVFQTNYDILLSYFDTDFDVSGNDYLFKTESAVLAHPASIFGDLLNMWWVTLQQPQWTPWSVNKERRLAEAKQMMQGLEILWYNMFASWIDDSDFNAVFNRILIAHLRLNKLGCFSLTKEHEIELSWRSPTIGLLTLHGDDVPVEKMLSCDDNDENRKWAADALFDILALAAERMEFRKETTISRLFFVPASYDPEKRDPKIWQLDDFLERSQVMESVNECRERWVFWIVVEQLHENLQEGDFSLLQPIAETVYYNVVQVFHAGKNDLSSSPSFWPWGIEEGATGVVESKFYHDSGINEPETEVVQRVLFNCGLNCPT